MSANQGSQQTDVRPEQNGNPPRDQNEADLSESTIMSNEDNSFYQKARTSELDEEKTRELFGDPEINFSNGDDTSDSFPVEVEERTAAAKLEDSSLETDIAAFERSLTQFEGMTPERAQTVGAHLRQAFHRLDAIKPEQFGKSDSAQQIRSIMTDINRVMEHDGTINGEKIYSQEDQNKIIEDMARSAADPEKYVNQGRHNTCVAQSNRLSHMTTDPADAVRIGRELATTGSTVFKGAAGDQPRKIDIDEKSMRFDSEARAADDTTTGEGGKQGPFGQLYALAAVKGALQIRAERQSPGGDIAYSYEQLPEVSKEDSGERTFQLSKKPDGTYEKKQVGECPTMTAADSCDMARLTMGETDGLMIQRDTMKALAIPEHEGINTFGDGEELERIASDYQERTGRPPRFFVDGNRLPDREPRTAEPALHQMAMRYKQQSATFDDDGQTWGTKYDRPGKDMTISDVIAATSIVPADTAKNSAKARFQHDGENASETQAIQTMLNEAISAEGLDGLYNTDISKLLYR